MSVIKPLGYFVFLLLFIHGTYTLSCPKPGGHNCNPIGRPPASCITQIQTGSGLTWFDMEKRCGADSGRLVWLRDDFTSTHLIATEKSLTKTSFNVTTFISIGLIQSQKGDGFTFWRTPDDNTTFSCGSEDTDTCLASATPEHCKMIGCCWVNGKCQYPEQQLLTENNRSAAIDSSAVAATTTRRCVGLQKIGSTWSQKAYSCSTPGVTGAGFVCEYKCGKDWPHTSTSITQRNVTWPQTPKAGIPTTDMSAVVNTTDKSAVVNTTTGPGKNNARSVSDTKAVTGAMITVCMTLFALISCSLTS